VVTAIKATVVPMRLIANKHYQICNCGCNSKLVQQCFLGNLGIVKSLNVANRNLTHTTDNLRHQITTRRTLASGRRHTSKTELMWATSTHMTRDE